MELAHCLRESTRQDNQNGIAQWVGGRMENLESLRKPQLDTLEARRKITKLGLEEDLLRWQMTWQGRMLEWLKVVTAPAAVAGVLVTLFMGLAQLRHAETNRVSDQLDKVTIRLGSKVTTDRLAGVAGAGLFLTPERQEYHSSALGLLLTALAVEEDSVVQTAILGRLAALDQSNHIRQAELDAALAMAVSYNRQLVLKMLAFRKDADEARDKAVRRRHLPAGFETFDQGAQARALAALTAQQVVRFMADASPRYLSSTSAIPTYHVEDVWRIEFPREIMSRLLASMQAIEILLTAGATTADMSGIYCENCKFNRRATASYRKVRFDGAILVGADFSGLNLEGASFRNADLRGTFFLRSNLTDATLADGFGGPRLPLDKSGAPVPYLACANLNGADLSGRALLSVQIRMDGAQSIAIASVPYLGPAQFNDRTVLDKIAAVVEVRIPNWYIAPGSRAAEVPPQHKATFKSLAFDQAQLPPPDGLSPISAWQHYNVALGIRFAALPSYFSFQIPAPSRREDQLEGVAVLTSRGYLNVSHEHMKLPDGKPVTGEHGAVSPALASVVSAALQHPLFQSDKYLARFTEALPSPRFPANRSALKPVEECGVDDSLDDRGLSLNAQGRF